MEVHDDYMYLLIVLFFSFGVSGYYFFILAKYVKKLNTECHTQAAALTHKQRTLFNLSLSHFIRCVSLMFIIITSNKTGNDFIAFVNCLVHVVPSLYFFSIFFVFMQFLIEKYYELTTKHAHVLFVPNAGCSAWLLSMALLVLGVTCLTTKRYNTMYVVCDCTVCVLCMVLSVLYLYYGVRLAKVYAEGVHKVLYRRMMVIGVVVGVVYMLRGVAMSAVLCGWVSGEWVDVHVNVWDGLVFGVSELACSWVIGYTRKDRKRESGLERVEFVKAEGVKMVVNVDNEEGEEEGGLLLELKDSLLEEFENENEN